MALPVKIVPGTNQLLSGDFEAASHQHMNN